MSGTNIDNSSSTTSKLENAHQVSSSSTVDGNDNSANTAKTIINKGQVIPFSVRLMREEDVDGVLGVWTSVGLHEGTHSISSHFQIDPQGFFVAVHEETGQLYHHFWSYFIPASDPWDTLQSSSSSTWLFPEVVYPRHPFASLHFAMMIIMVCSKLHLMLFIIGSEWCVNMIRGHLYHCILLFILDKMRV